MAHTEAAIDKLLGQGLEWKQATLTQVEDAALKIRMRQGSEKGVLAETARREKEEKVPYRARPPAPTDGSMWRRAQKWGEGAVSDNETAK